MKTKIEDLTPQQLSEMLGAFEVLEQIGQAVKARAIELAHLGVEIPGYEKCMTAARRMWADEDQATATLGKLGLEKRERYVVELVSPAQAEKLLRKKGLWPKRPRGALPGPTPLDKLVAYTDTKPTIRKDS